MLQEKSLQNLEPLSPVAAPIPYKTKPKFKPSDIVYLLFWPEYGGDMPCIGSGKEIDCKIISVCGEEEMRDAYNFYYNIITGNGKFYNQIIEAALIPASQYLYHIASKTFELKEDTELASKGTKFFQLGEYMVSEDRTIMIHHLRFKEILNLFNQ